MISLSMSYEYEEALVIFGRIEYFYRGSSSGLGVLLVDRLNNAIVTMYSLSLMAMSIPQLVL